MPRNRTMLRHWSTLTQEERDEATEKARAYIKGMDPETIVWDRVASHCGVSHANGLRLLLDPAFRDKRNATARAYGATYRSILKSGGFSATVMAMGSDRVPRDDIAARLAEIPEDTRTITGRLFGDPLPGRRALDAKCQAKSPSL